MYCSVRLATLYRLPLVVNRRPSVWPDPNSATIHEEPSASLHELLRSSTVAESGRETCTVLWRETSGETGIHGEAIHTAAEGSPSVYIPC